MKHTTLNRCVLLTLTLALSAIPFSGRASTEAWRHRSCRYQSLDGKAGWAKGEIRDTVACMVTKYSVPGGFGPAIYVAERESGLNPRALNPYSGAAGIYQHIQRFWPGRVAAYRAANRHAVIGSSVFNPRANIAVSLWMVHVGGWGPWR